MSILVEDKITIGKVRSIADPVKRARKAFEYLEQSMHSGFRETVGYCQEGFKILEGDLARIQAIAISHPEYLGD